MTRAARIAVRLLACGVIGCGGGLFSTAIAAGVRPAAEASVPPPAAWPKEAFRPVTAERIAALPRAEQPAWRAYIEASERRARALQRISDHEETTPRPDGPPLGARHTLGLRGERPGAWYTSAEAALIADRVAERQSAAGAWTKGVDYTRPGAPVRGADGIDVWSRGTLDNDATSAELRFLARMLGAGAGDGAGERAARWRRALERGLEYLLAAQYPNGGLPQIYPLAGGYHDAITFNDGSMIRALEILRDAAAGEGGYDTVSPAVRTQAARAFERGLACILAAQIELPGGRRTAWGQQHDALDLRPCAARNFEPVATSSGESAALVEFLISQPRPSPALVRAVDDAVAWLRGVALPDVVWDKEATSGSGLRPAPGSLLWARLYEIGTDRPVFGDRERRIHYAVTELASERRLGYGWYGSAPSRVLELYAAWRSRQPR